MPYVVHCGCGKAVTVEASQAGSTKMCACGRNVAVPSMSQLRRSAGETLRPQSVLDRIRRSIDDGELPSNIVCPISGRRADVVMQFHIQCESQWVRQSRPDSFFRLLVLFTVGWLAAILMPKQEATREEFGRDTWIEVPVRISSDAASSIAGMSQGRLKALLEDTPIYGELLREYPDSMITPMSAS